MSNYQQKFRKTEEPTIKVSGKFYSLDRFASGYRIITTTVEDGMVTNVEHSEYDRRPIQEAKIIRLISTDLYDSEPQGVVNS